jgi:hypothetical protein
MILNSDKIILYKSVSIKKICVIFATNLFSVMAYSDIEKQNIFDSICELIINGKSLRYALKEINLPAKTFFVWLRENDELSKQYARATDERAELMFEDMFDIADDSTSDYIETDNGKQFNSEHLQRSKLRVDTRKWALSKLMPKKYGDKLDITSKDEAIQQQPTIVFKKYEPNE